MSSYCEEEKKISYGRKEAERVLKGMKRSRHVNKKPRRIYYCTHCKQWHITSKVKHNKNGGQHSEQ